MKKVVVMVYEDLSPEMRFLASEVLDPEAKYTMWFEDGNWMCRKEYEGVNDGIK